MGIWQKNSNPDIFHAILEDILRFNSDIFDDILEDILTTLTKCSPTDPNRNLPAALSAWKHDKVQRQLVMLSNLRQIHLAIKTNTFDNSRQIHSAIRHNFFVNLIKIHFVFLSAREHDKMKQFVISTLRGLLPLILSDITNKKWNTYRRNDFSLTIEIISFSGTKTICSDKKVIFLFSGKEDAANNFARGHYTVGKEVIDMVGWLKLMYSF